MAKRKALTVSAVKRLTDKIYLRKKTGVLRKLQQKSHVLSGMVSEF